MSVLFDAREEKFAQFIAQGLDPKAARAQSGLPKSRPLKRLLAEPRIKDRIDHLLQIAANRTVLSRMDILDGIKEEWRLARAAAQHGAALKAAEMLGTELHGMFRKQLEVGRVGEFEAKSEEELREYITNQMKELGLEVPPQPKTITLQPIQEAEPSSADSSVTADR